MKISNAVQKQIEQWIQEDPNYESFTKVASENKAKVEPMLKALAESEEALRVALLAHLQLSKKTRRKLKQCTSKMMNHSFLAGKRRGFLHLHLTNNYVDQFQRDQLKKNPPPQSLPAQP